MEAQQLLAVLKNGSDKELLKVFKRFVGTVNSGAYVDDPANGAVVSELFQVLLASRTPLRRFACYTAILRLAPHRLDALERSVRVLSPEGPVQDYLFALSLALGTPKAFQANAPNISHWLSTTDADFRFRIIPGLLATLRADPALLPGAVIQQSFDTFQHILLKAAPISSGADSARSSAWMSRLSNTPVQTVYEPDGNVARDFFTIMNRPMMFSHEQCLNYQCFSALSCYLSTLYRSDTPCDVPIKPLSDALVSYCLRTMDQAKICQAKEITSRLDSSGLMSNSMVAENASFFCLQMPLTTFVSLTPGAPGLDVDAGMTSFSEAISILNVLAHVDPSILARVLPVMQRSAQLNICQSDFYVYIQLMQFFLDHSGDSQTHYDEHFQFLFETFMAVNYTNELIDFALFDFLDRNADKLLEQTHVFSQYFPCMFKMLAWNPFGLFEQFMDILPFIVNEVTFQEVINCILDLPLLVSLLEKQQGEIWSGYRMDDISHDLLSVCNFILRPHSYAFVQQTQSGAYDNIEFWRKDDLRLMLQNYFMTYMSSERVNCTTKIVKPLLKSVLALIAEQNDVRLVEKVVQMFFYRCERKSLFVGGDSQDDVRDILLKFITDSFEKYPSLLVSLREEIQNIINDSDKKSSSKKLILTLVWAIGEFSSVDMVKPSSQSMAIVRDYIVTTLQPCLFEVMSLVKLDCQENGIPDFTKEMSGEDIYTTELVIVIIGALSKLGSRWQLLSKLVMDVTLQKMVAYLEYLHPCVKERVNECAAVLLYPSIAASVMGHRRQLGAPLADSSSPLPLLLQSTDYRHPVPSEVQGVLHQYTLHSLESQSTPEGENFKL